MNKPIPQNPKTPRKTQENSNSKQISGKNARILPAEIPDIS